MLLDSGDNGPVRAQNNNLAPHPPSKLAEPLTCPRCQSTNTKFCYYNNYNLSQPRHFCKACRRYWTHGGTLRNVPVGGGTRKNSRRCRSSSSSTSTSSSSTPTSTSTLTYETELLRLPSNPDPALRVVKADTDNSNLTDNNLPVPGTGNGNFVSLLNAQQGQGFPGMKGYGSSFGYGFCEMGLGYDGRGAWGYPGMGFVGGDFTWQVGDVGGGSEEAGGFVDGDCFSLPSLAISGPEKGFK